MVSRDQVWTAGADRVDGRSGVGADIAAVAADRGLESPPAESLIGQGEDFLGFSRQDGSPTAMRGRTG